MSTDALRPSSPDSSPDPSSIALPPSPTPTYSPSQLPINDPVTRERLGVDHVYRPKAVQVDAPPPAPSSGASGVPRAFPSLARPPSPPAPPPRQPDYALMAFQTPDKMQQLVHALGVHQVQQDRLHYQALMQEQGKIHRREQIARGEKPTRPEDAPTLWTVQSEDGKRWTVDNKIMGMLAAREPESSTESESTIRRELEKQKKLLAIEEAKGRAADEELRGAQMEMDQESTDRDEEDEVEQVVKVGKKKKRKAKGKKKAVVPTATVDVSVPGLEGGEAQAGVKAEEVGVEERIKREWEDLGKDQGIENFHRSAAEYQARLERWENEVEGEGENREREETVKPKDMVEDAKPEEDEGWMEKSPELEAKAIKKSKKKSGHVRSASSRQLEVDAKEVEEAEVSETAAPGAPEAFPTEEAASQVAPKPKIASKTVFDQLGPSSTPSPATSSPATLPSALPVPEATAGLERGGKAKKEAKKELRRLARAEKFKDVHRVESSSSIAESQTSSTVASSSVPPAPAIAALTPNVDAVAVRKAVWKAEKRRAAKLVKALPPPASMPPVSIAPAVPVVTAPPVAPATPLPVAHDIPTTSATAVEWPLPGETEEEPTPRPFHPRTLPDDDQTPTWPTVRLPTVSFHEASPAPRLPSLPAAQQTFVTTFGTIDEKPTTVPEIITTLPSSSTLSDTASTLSVSIIEPTEPLSPAPATAVALRFGSISPDDLAGLQGGEEEVTIDEELEKIRAEGHGRSLTAPARHVGVDPRTAIAPRNVKEKSQSRNVSSPAAIQYEEQAPATPVVEIETVVESEQRVVLPTPPINPAPAQTKIMQRPRDPRALSPVPVPLPDNPLLRAPAPPPRPPPKVAPVPSTPAVPTRPAGRFTPLYPSISMGVPIEEAPKPHVSLRPDPANEPAPPPHLTPELSTREYKPSSAPAIITKRPLVPPIFAEPLLGEFDKTKRGQVGYAALPQMPSLPSIPSFTTVPPADEKAPAPEEDVGEDDASACSSSSDEVVVRLPPPPVRRPTPTPTPQPQVVPALPVTSATANPPPPAPVTAGTNTTIAITVPAAEEPKEMQEKPMEVAVPVFETAPPTIAPAAETAEGSQEKQVEIGAPPRQEPDVVKLQVAPPRPASPPPAGQDLLPVVVDPTLRFDASGQLKDVPWTPVEEPSIRFDAAGRLQDVQEIPAGQAAKEPEPTPSAPSFPTVVGVRAANAKAAEWLGKEKEREDAQGVVVIPDLPPRPASTGIPSAMPSPIAPLPTAIAPTPSIAGPRSLLPSPVMNFHHPVRPFRSLPAHLTTPHHRLPSSSSVPRTLFQSPPTENPYGPCPLVRSWTLFFSDTSPTATRPRASVATTAHYSGALVPIFTAATAEELFGGWKAFRRVLAAHTGREIEPLGNTMYPEHGGLGIQGLRDDHSFHLFTKGVLPMWEDPMAEKGGKMMFAGKPNEVHPTNLHLHLLVEVQEWTDADAIRPQR